MSEHFSELEWALYTRRSNTEGAQGIAEHLAAQCPSCQQAYGFWRLLADTVMAPAAPVPSLERALAWAHEAPVRRGWTGVRLAFDSFAFPQAQTVRSSRPARRHCVYEMSEGAAATASIEVMTERVSSHSGWSVVGQILDESGEGRGGCTVQLAGTEVTEPESTQLTNGFGEFAFVRGDAGPWRLQVDWNDRLWEIAPVLTP